MKYFVFECDYCDTSVKVPNSPNGNAPDGWASVCLEATREVQGIKLPTFSHACPRCVANKNLNSTPNLVRTQAVITEGVDPDPKA